VLCLRLLYVLLDVRRSLKSGWELKSLRPHADTDSPVNDSYGTNAAVYFENVNGYICGQNVKVDCQSGSCK
jgi:hypothetical protein